MDVDSDEKTSSSGHIAELETIEDNVEDLLRNVHSTMSLLSQIDPEKENEIKEYIAEYHTLLQKIESSLRKQIDQCREPLLLPLLPIGHKNQFIPNQDARDIHRRLFSTKNESQDQRSNRRAKSTSRPAISTSQQSTKSAQSTTTKGAAEK